MDKRRKFTKEQKIEVVKKYLSGTGSATSLAREVGCNASTIQKWIIGYRFHKEDFFSTLKGNRSYSKEFKTNAVEYYLGHGSERITAIKFNIPVSVLERWIKAYNEGKLKDYYPMPEVYAMKGRRTTFEERKEIVKYCLKHNKNYKETAKIYSLPYSRVYMMVKKYIEGGDEGLMDAKQKASTKPLTELEKLQKENEKLRRELELEKLRRELVQKKIALGKERLQKFKKKTNSKQ